jgi:hypothetical protein
MRLDSLLLADAATAVEGKLFMHGGGISRITPPSVPWLQPQLAFVLRLVADGRDDLNQEHSVSISMRGPDGEFVMPPAGISIPGGQAPPAVPEEETSALVALTAAPLVFGQEGTYRIDIEIDNKPARTMSLPVVVTPPARQPEPTQPEQKPRP